MRPSFILLVCCTHLLTGCSLLGYHKYEKARRAPLAESEKVTFPNSYAEGIQLDGPSLAALSVALNEFMPPGSEAKTPSEPMSRCLSRRDTYDVSVLKADDGLYFVNILPDLSRCGIEPTTPLLDVGATYAIDKEGRILSEL